MRLFLLVDYDRNDNDVDHTDGNGDVDALHHSYNDESVDGDGDDNEDGDFDACNDRVGVEAWYVYMYVSNRTRNS